LRLSTVGEMASGLAHEVNQPLCAIVSHAQGSLQMMRSGQWDCDELLGSMEDIAQQAERAGQIIHRMVRLVRKQKPHKTSIDLRDIIEETIEFIEGQAKVKGVTILRSKPSGKIPLILADRIQIEQVLLNLLQNSLEAMSDIHDRKRVITIGVSADRSGSVVVSVTDTGKGLPSEKTEEVFEPFFTTKPKGLGIGLSISKTLIEAHAGRLWAEPNPAGGAIFRFALPGLKRRSS